MGLLPCSTIRKPIEVEWCANSYVQISTGKTGPTKAVKQTRFIFIPIENNLCILELFDVFWLKMGTQKLQLWMKQHIMQTLLLQAFFNKNKLLKFAIHRFHSSVPETFNMFHCFTSLFLKKNGRFTVEIQETEPLLWRNSMEIPPPDK